MNHTDRPGKDQTSKSEVRFLLNMSFLPCQKSKTSKLKDCNLNHYKTGAIFVNEITFTGTEVRTSVHVFGEYN